MSETVTTNEDGALVIDMAKADALWRSLDPLKQAELTNIMFEPVLKKAKEQADRIDELEAKHTELVSAVNDLLHDVKYSLLDEELSDEEGYELWEDVKKFRRVICAAGLAKLKGQNDE